MITVEEHYSEVAQSVLEALEEEAVVGRASCCEAPLTGSEAAALYSQQILDALPEGAKAASRGCGDPVSVAAIEPGERVLDLGSGGGIDALIAGALVGGERPYLRRGYDQGHDRSGTEECGCCRRRER